MLCSASLESLPSNGDFEYTTPFLQSLFPPFFLLLLHTHAHHHTRCNIQSPIHARKKCITWPTFFLCSSFAFCATVLFMFFLVVPFANSPLGSGKKKIIHREGRKERGGGKRWKNIGALFCWPSHEQKNTLFCTLLGHSSISRRKREKEGQHHFCGSDRPVHAGHSALIRFKPTWPEFKKRLLRSLTRFWLNARSSLSWNQDFQLQWTVFLTVLATTSPKKSQGPNQAWKKVDPPSTSF